MDGSGQVMIDDLLMDCHGPSVDSQGIGRGASVLPHFPMVRSTMSLQPVQGYSMAVLKNLWTIKNHLHPHVLRWQENNLLCF